MNITTLLLAAAAIPAEPQSIWYILLRGVGTVGISVLVIWLVIRIINQD